MIDFGYDFELMELFRIFENIIFIKSNKFITIKTNLNNTYLMIAISCMKKSKN